MPSHYEQTEAKNVSPRGTQPIDQTQSDAD